MTGAGAFSLFSGASFFTAPNLPKSKRPGLCGPAHEKTLGASLRPLPSAAPQAMGSESAGGLDLLLLAQQQQPLVDAATVGRRTVVAALVPSTQNASADGSVALTRQEINETKQRLARTPWTYAEDELLQRLVNELCASSSSKCPAFML